jgi:hypothetical protein
MARKKKKSAGPPLLFSSINLGVSPSSSYTTITISSPGPKASYMETRSAKGARSCCPSSFAVLSYYRYYHYHYHGRPAARHKIDPLIGSIYTAFHTRLIYLLLCFTFCRRFVLSPTCVLTVLSTDWAALFFRSHFLSSSLACFSGCKHTRGRGSCSMQSWFSINCVDPCT